MCKLNDPIRTDNQLKYFAYGSDMEETVGHIKYRKEETRRKTKKYSHTYRNTPAHAHTARSHVV